MCSLHFRGKRKLGGNNIPTVFPDKDCTDEITWVGIDGGDTKDMAESNNDYDVSIKDEEMMPLVDDELTKIKNENERLKLEIQRSKEVKNDKNMTMTCMSSSQLKAKIADLSRQHDYKHCFGVEKFKEDDEAIRLYTGLPDYDTFLALYNFTKAAPGYQLNYKNNKAINGPKHLSYVNIRGRLGTLSDMDELFLTLQRLRLDLLETDLHHRYDIPVTTVSEIFITWIDRLDYCLQYLDEIPGLEDGLRHLLPESFK